MLHGSVALCALALATLLVTGCESANYTSTNVLAPAARSTAMGASSSANPELAPALKSPANTVAAAAAYDQVFKIWAGGNQKAAEASLETLVQQYPGDQRLAFFRAMCTRSRFDLEAARSQLLPVEAMNPDSPEGRTSRLIVQLDETKNPQDAVHRLASIFTSHQNDPLITWAFAIECRQYNAARLGAALYETLLREIAPAQGPVLLHQTYANLLDDLGQSDRALEHRQITIKIEPSGWAYQGLANTLTRLKRYDEANRAYAQATTRDPHESLYWQTWGWSLQCAGNYKEAIVKCQQAISLQPANAAAWNVSADCYELLGKHNEAFKALEVAIRLQPLSLELREKLVVVAQEMKEAARARENAEHLPASPTAQL